MTAAPDTLRQATSHDDDPGRRWNPALIAACGLGAVVILLVVGWLVDNLVHSGRVNRNVILAGRPVGGLDRDRLSVAVGEIARDYSRAQVAIDAPGAHIVAQGPELGLSLRQDQTVVNALEVGRSGFVLNQFLGWFMRLFRPALAPATVRVDQRSIERILVERDPGRLAPTEPSIAAKDDRMVAVAGNPGRGIDPASVTRLLTRAAPRGLPLEVKADREPLAPRFSAADAEGLAQRAEEVAGNGLVVMAGPAGVTLDRPAIRALLSARPAFDQLVLAVDAGRIPNVLSRLFPTVGRPAVDAGFAISGDQVTVTPSRTGLRCCAPQAAAIIENALLNPSSDRTPVQLPVEVTQPRRSEQQARGLGVIEPVASFTTNHPAGQPRVANIHRIADAVRGAVIEPGRTFSVNDYVGERTTAKGYVDAPIIGEGGVFSTSPGGGVSQFATTLFNAGFFAGLDIPAYTMHSLYISRYPYGREATLSFPGLDLKLRNATPYGVLIWPTYTDTSLTITLYSTRSVVGEQTGQSASVRGICTSVSTERTRRYVDGRSAVDKFYALYAPKEGEVCR